MNPPNKPRSAVDGVVQPLSVPVLAYHKINDGHELGVNSIPPQVFDRQMRFLAENGYTAITVDRFIEAIEAFSHPEKNLKTHSFSPSRLKQKEHNRTSDPLSRQESGSPKGEGFGLPPRSIMITFDDGYEDVYTSAYPILAKYGMTATVFVLAGYIGKFNTWDVRLRLKQSPHLTGIQIQNLFGKGFGIASHGMHHRFLTRCDEANTRAELWESKAILEGLLHHPVHGFAYPYGSLNSKVAERVKSAGYRVAFGLKPSASDSIYSYPRMAIYRCDTLTSFQAKLGLSGGRRFKLECMKNSIINRFAYLNLLRR